MIDDAINAGKDIAKKKITMGVIGAIASAIGSIGCLPILLIILIVVVIIAPFAADDSDSSIGGITYIEGSGDALYDGSYTKETFVKLVENYIPPNSTHNGRAYSWGYTRFFESNAENFFDISTKYGMDPRFIFCIGIHESAYGTSKIALEKGNFFGWGAYDSSPYSSALAFYDMSNGIETVAKGLSTNYVVESGAYYNTIKNNGYDPTTIQGIGSVYASDPSWAKSVSSYIQKIFGESYSTASPDTSTILDNYPLDGGNAKFLTSALNGEQQAKLNNSILTAVNKAGYGTGAGVAAAGQTLVYELYKMGYKLPYKSGGGHASKAVIGVDSKWGVNSYGYDCSGFVSWTIANACDSNFTPTTSSGFLKYGKSISVKNAKPGDLYVTSGHVALVVKNNGDGTVVTVEERNPSKGLTFTTQKSNIIDMSNWYSNNCKKFGTVTMQ